uniref:Uncharacterized protein n=1 Tax=Oryza barthii TaxID=65489 RepID=A0A0D3FSH7_9ORYZ
PCHLPTGAAARITADASPTPASPISSAVAAVRCRRAHRRSTPTGTAARITEPPSLPLPPAPSRQPLPASPIYSDRRHANRRSRRPSIPTVEDNIAAIALNHLNKADEDEVLDIQTILVKYNIFHIDQ